MKITSRTNSLDQLQQKKKQQKTEHLFKQFDIYHLWVNFEKIFFLNKQPKTSLFNRMVKIHIYDSTNRSMCLLFMEWAVTFFFFFGITVSINTVELIVNSNTDLFLFRLLCGKFLLRQWYGASMRNEKRKNAALMQQVNK